MAEFTFKHPSGIPDTHNHFIYGNGRNILEIKFLSEKVQPTNDIYISIISVNGTNLIEGVVTQSFEVATQIKYADFKDAKKYNGKIVADGIGYSVWLSLGVLKNNIFVKLDKAEENINAFEFSVSCKLH